MYVRGGRTVADLTAPDGRFSPRFEWQEGGGISWNGYSVSIPTARGVLGAAVADAGRDPWAIALATPVLLADAAPDVLGLAAWGVTRLAASKIAPKAVVAPAAESGVWKLNPFTRGQQIEQALGHNLPGNFPVIDKFENGLATSIKSLDLDAATYQSGSTLTRTLNGYVDKVAGFQGRTWAGVRIRPQDVTGRALDLAIPHSGSAAQQASSVRR